MPENTDFLEMDKLFGTSPVEIQKQEFAELDELFGTSPVEPIEIEQEVTEQEFLKMDDLFGTSPQEIIQQPEISTTEVPLGEPQQIIPDEQDPQKVAETLFTSEGEPQRELSEFAPARAIGATETAVPEQRALGEEIPTRAPIPSTPLAATAIGALESVPFAKTILGKELTGGDIDKIEKEHPGSVVAGQIVGSTAQAFAGGVAAGKILAKTAVAKSPLLLNTLSRVAPAVTLRGAQSADEINQGKTEIKEALMNTLVESGGGAAFSMIPEIIMPAGIAQVIAQPLADIIYQAGVDKLKGEKDVLSKEWFKKQIPTIAASLGFAIKDVADGKQFISQQKAIREEIKDIVTPKPKPDVSHETVPKVEELLPEKDAITPELEPVKPVKQEKVEPIPPKIDEIEPKLTPEEEGLKRIEPDKEIVKNSESEKHEFQTGDRVIVEAFHGTDLVFDTFKKEFLGENTGAKSAKKGFFFSSNKENSKIYAGITEKEFDEFNNNFKKASQKMAKLLNVKKIGKNLDIRDYNDKVESKSIEINKKKKDIFNDFKEVTGGFQLDDLDDLFKVYKDETFSQAIKKAENAGLIDKAKRFIDENKVFIRLQDDIEKNSLLLDSIDLKKQKIAKKLGKVEDIEGFGIDSFRLETTPNIRKEYISMDNPYVYKEPIDDGSIESVLEKKRINEIMGKAIENGHDSVIIKGKKDPLKGDIYVTFDPGKIISKKELTPEEEAFVKKVRPEVTEEKPIPKKEVVKKPVKEELPKRPKVEEPKKTKPVVEEKPVETKPVKQKEIRPTTDKPEQFKTGRKESILDNESGFVRLDLKPKEGKKLQRKSSEFANFMKKNFTTKGHLPEEVFQEKITKDSWVGAELKDIETTVNKFRTESKKAYKKSKLTDEQQFDIDSALKGEKPIASLPENLQPVVIKMRAHIDAISQRMIDAGVVEGDLEAKVTENMGFYATRSYRVYDDPKWSEKVPGEVRNKAKAFIRQEANEFYNKKIEATEDVINNLLSVKTQIETKLKSPLSVDQRLNIEKKVDELGGKIDELLSQKEDIGFDVENEINDISKKILDIRFGEQRIPSTEREFKFHQERIDKLNKKIDVLSSGKRTDAITKKINEHKAQIKKLEAKAEKPLSDVRISNYQEKLKNINSRIDKLVNKMPELEKKSKPTDDQVEGQIDELLYKEGAPVSVLASGSKLGAKNLSVLKRRKDIPVEIRSLWGEYKNADVNYAKSVSKMANLIANQKFLAKVKTKGEGKFFFDEPIRKDGKSFSVKISADNSPSMKPLDGPLYTTKEIKEAFELANQRDVPGDALRLYMRINSAAKYSKTIGSLMTHVRNVTGNIGFAIANGHFNVLEMPKAIKATFQDIKGMPNDEMARYLRKLTELGVVNDGARAGEIRDIIKDATQGDLDVLIGTGPKQGIKKIFRGIEKLYGSEDDVWKIFAYENELKRYKKHLPDMPEKELEKKVANIVRNTYPTYSMIPEGIKKLRRFPLVGTFVSFPAEVIRTTKNTIELTAKELKDPKLRGIGAQRLAGIVMASTITAGIAIASRFRNGITNEKEEAAREFMAPWTRNSQIVWASEIQNGKANYVDLGYSDPHSYMKKAITAFMRGEDWKSKLYETATELLSPFLSEDMLAQKLLDIKRNKTKDGQPVYNEQDKIENQTKDVLNHVISAMEPGTVASLRRIDKATKEQEGQYGSSYDVKTEITALGTGVRVSVLNVKKSLGFKAFRFNREIRDAARLASKRGIPLSFEQKRKIYDRFSKTISAAKILGLRESEIKSTLKDARISQKKIDAFMNNTYDRLLKLKEIDKIKKGK